MYFNDIENTEVSMAMYVSYNYKILRSWSPEEFFIALAIGLLLKSNTDDLYYNTQSWGFETSLIQAYSAVWRLTA